MINRFNGEPFHVALARPRGSFEFTYAEIGLGTTTVTGDMEMAYENSWAHFCIHHFNQDGLVRESVITSYSIHYTKLYERSLATGRRVLPACASGGPRPRS